MHKHEPNPTAFNEAHRADLASSLERIERPKAKDRQKEGGRKGGLAKERVDDGKPQLKDRTTTRVAKAVGISRKTYERCAKIKKKGRFGGHKERPKE